MTVGRKLLYTCSHPGFKASSLRSLFETELSDLRLLLLLLLLLPQLWLKPKC
jgi:hypothetical protein